MTSGSFPAQQALRKTSRRLRLFGAVLAVAVFFFGALLFLQQAHKLLLLGFGLGERVEIGVWAIIDLAGAAVAALMVRSLVGAVADALEFWVEQAAVQQ